jgi:hypothetical protein
MSALSYANAWAQINAVVNLLQKLELFGNSASPNFDTLHQTLRAATSGDYKAQVLAAAQNMRGGLSSLLSPAATRALLSPAMLDIARAIDAPERDYDGIMRRLYDYMHANSKTINSRGLTRGSPSAGGSNVGNGTVYRVTSDALGYALESSTSEVKTLLCIADQTSEGGEKHREVFEVRGAEALDDLFRGGTGLVTQIRCLDVRDSAAILRNPGFDTFSGTAPAAGSPATPSAVTSITGWTLDSVTSVTVGIDTPSPYRTPVGETAAKWVRFAANRTMTQAISAVTRAKFRRDVPYIFQVAVYRESSCDGTLTISVGAVSRAVDMTTLSNGAWNVVDVPDPQGANCWYDNMAENDMDISFALTSRTTGALELDDIVFAPMTAIDGAFVALVGGATPFKVKDTFTITDSEATRGINQYWISHRAQAQSLPSNNAGGETEADPS